MSARPLRILSLDGGGIKVLTEILILKCIMQRVRVIEERRLAMVIDQVPAPWKYFDLICGSGTGGLLALMLGRLRMVIILSLNYPFYLLLLVHCYLVSTRLRGGDLDLV